MFRGQKQYTLIDDAIKLNVPDNYLKLYIYTTNKRPKPILPTF